MRAVPADESPRATCVFCEIVAGREPASVVYSDAGIIAFMDLRPINAGHLLVVPRGHAARLANLDERLGAAMFGVGQRLAGAIRRSGLPCQGVNLFVADGEVAGQEVMHVHLHVLPRIPGDGFRIERGSETTGRAELDQAAALVKGGLDRAD
jgi:histidine triad (HIT) family protein